MTIRERFALNLLDAVAEHVGVPPVTIRACLSLKGSDAHKSEAQSAVHGIARDAFAANWRPELKLTKLLRGETSPSLDDLEALERALGICASDLLAPR